MNRVATGALAAVLLSSAAHAQSPERKGARGIAQHLDEGAERGAARPVAPEKSTSPPVRPAAEAAPVTSLGAVFDAASKRIDAIRQLMNAELGEEAVAAPSPKDRIRAYDAYATKAIAEAGAANTNSSNRWPWSKTATPVRELRRSEYEQAKESVALVRSTAEATKDPEFLTSASRLERWLDEGWILVDENLEDGVNAETRRDGGQKSALTPQVLAERTPGDGNVYLNARADRMFESDATRDARRRELTMLEKQIGRRSDRISALESVSPRTSEQEKQLACERSLRATNERQLERARLLDSPTVSTVLRAAVLAHEERHTRQLATREAPCYDHELRFLRAVRASTKDADEARRLDLLIQTVETDRKENVK